MSVGYKSICNFNDIVLQSDTLYVLDFDETVAHYDGVNQKWWEQRFNYYYNQHGNYDQADDQSLKDWREHICVLEPRHVDQKGFNAIVKHCSQGNSHVIILTARNTQFEDVTRSHLNIIYPHRKLDIVFCNGYHKAHKLQSYLDQHEYKYEHIIFVDDHLDNLADFSETYKHAQCYYMQFNASATET